MPAALAAMQRAVLLAYPERYVRLFADEGPPAAGVLKALPNQPAAPGYAGRHLAATMGRAERPALSRVLTDPLSDRELDVLRLLGTDLDGPDIARELSVSLNTMRTHTKNIYAKLDVSSRRAAVTRAGERTCSRTSGERVLNRFGTCPEASRLPARVSWLAPPTGLEPMTLRIPTLPLVSDDHR
jgi:DNA-binding CsgD family transcriptional regulator